MLGFRMMANLTSFLPGGQMNCAHRSLIEQDRKEEQRIFRGLDKINPAGMKPACTYTTYHDSRAASHIFTKEVLSGTSSEQGV